MKNLKKIALFSFALVLGLLTFVSFSTKANEALDCGENTPIEVTINWNGPEDPNYVVEVCPGEVMSDVPETPAYPGYTFDKFTSGDADIDLTTNTEWGTEPTFEVVAQWTANVINLEFVYPTTAPPANVTATVGQTFDLAPYNTTAQDDATEGQVFTGWTYTLDTDTVTIPANETSFTIPAMEANATLTLTAQYGPAPVEPTIVDVTLVLPEGVEWADGYTWTTTQTAGETITLPTAEDVVISTGEVLKGWAVTPDTDNTRGVEMYIPGASYEVPTSDVTLTAVIGDEETGGEVTPPVTPETGDGSEGGSTVTTVPQTGSNAMFMAIAAAITATSLVAVRKLRA